MPVYPSNCREDLLFWIFTRNALVQARISSSWFFRQKLQKPRTQICINPQAKVLNYCYKCNKSNHQSIVCFGFWFLVCYAATQLATQLRQRCIQVVRSNKEARKHLTESNGTPSLFLPPQRHAALLLEWRQSRRLRHNLGASLAPPLRVQIVSQPG